MRWNKLRWGARGSMAREAAAIPYNAEVGHSHHKPPGPMRADQINDGDPIELSDGHPIHCMSAGRRHAGAHIEGAKALATDPAVEDDAGIDAGVVWNDGKNLRAPDIVVGGLEREPGWMDKAPPLAVEYADTGQNESDLHDKIGELISAGTQIIWVVRLKDELCVEIYEPGKPMRVATAEENLEAPGILQNPVPVRALVDPAESNRVALRNLLQRFGYGSLEQIQSDSEQRGKLEGDIAGRRSALFTLLSARGLEVDGPTQRRINECRDVQVLDSWIARAAIASTMAEAIPGK